MRIPQNSNSADDLFSSFKEGLLNLDPCRFCETYLTLDGDKFRLHGNGYKPFADIYRYIGVKALEPNAKPVVMVKGRQVGATTMCAALEIYFMCSGLFGFGSRPPMRLMHCFPTLVHAFAYTKTKFNAMISGAIPSNEKGKIAGRSKSYAEAMLDTNTASNDSLQFKQFLGGNHVWIESTGIDGNRLRNRTVDCMFFDEVQDIPENAIGTSTKILSKAKYGKVGEGIQIYFGTPKRKGSSYYKMWQMSSQQYYYLGCEKCGKHFPLYTPNSNEWEKIWLYGFIVKCTHCGFEQDKRAAAERGKWVSANDNPEAPFIGYHINQLYMPEFTKEYIISAKPENHPTNTERLYMNEVLGEFYDGEGGPVSKEEIHVACADHERKMRANIAMNEPRRVYLGCDWGGKDMLEEEGGGGAGQSYSCVVVLSTTGSNKFSIDFATRLKRNDPESKRGIVEQMFRQYSVRVGVGDIGFANDLTQDLQRMYGNRFIASRVVPKINQKIKFDEDIFPKTILFEKEHYLAELFGMLKKGNVRFPYGSYEQISWLVDHCSSMEIKVTLRNGEPAMKYVKGATPNDGLMALLNAYLAYLFDATSGFKSPIDNSILMPEKKKSMIIGAHIPGMR